jgi:hypothetical protein
LMAVFSREVLQAAAREKEVTLTTHGRSSGRPHHVTIWVVTDGRRIFIRSGQGLTRHWPRNFITGGRGTLQLGEHEVAVTPRHVSDSAEARAISRLYAKKYGPYVKPSKPSEPLTPGESASFELTPIEF